MSSEGWGEPPMLPLVAVGIPVGLEQALRQEGVSLTVVSRPSVISLRAGRFVLFDGREVGADRLRAQLSPSQVPLDVGPLRGCVPGVRDAFAAMVDTRSAMRRWRVGDRGLVERVARFPKGAIRRAMISRLREMVTGAGGIWARIAPAPFPFQSVFGLRLDFDESGYTEDAIRSLDACRLIEDCTTVFVSTYGYGGDLRVLDRLRGFDVQSHGHFHAVYRDPAANERNIRRARAELEKAGFAPRGFAGPGGRWNAGLDSVLDKLGYDYSSEFGHTYDDWPSNPWRGSRESRVLQVPIHPICEGLFQAAGESDSDEISSYFESYIGNAAEGGEPAWVYGHPERRLGRMPEVIERIARRAIESESLWRTNMTEFASWWRWRDSRRWTLERLDGGDRVRVRFDHWYPKYAIGLDVWRGGEHHATIRVMGPSVVLPLGSLAYRRMSTRIDVAAANQAPPPMGLKRFAREWLDWETVTPIDELPNRTWRDRLKRVVRTWKSNSDLIGGRR
jgi:hypothetical protein